VCVCRPLIPGTCTCENCNHAHGKREREREKDFWAFDDACMHLDPRTSLAHEASIWAYALCVRVHALNLALCPRDPPCPIAVASCVPKERARWHEQAQAPTRSGLKCKGFGVWVQCVVFRA